MSSFQYVTEKKQSWSNSVRNKDYSIQYFERQRLYSLEYYNLAFIKKKTKCNIYFYCIFFFSHPTKESPLIFTTSAPFHIESFF